MKQSVRLTALPLAAVMACALSFGALAAETKIDLQPNASVRDILESRPNLPVRLKLRSGEEIRGTVVKVQGSVVHIGRLDGADGFFDAIVALDAVAAVLVRVREK